MEAKGSPGFFFHQHHLPHHGLHLHHHELHRHPYRLHLQHNLFSGRDGQPEPFLYVKVSQMKNIEKDCANQNLPT